MLVVHGSINIVVVALYFYRFDQHFFNERGRRDADYIKKKMKPRLDKQQMKKNYIATPGRWIGASACTGLN